jgi:hypothetical protein
MSASWTEKIYESSFTNRKDGVDSGARCNGFMKLYLDVFAKLFEGLEWRLETEAFSRREIGGEDDVLDFFVGHFVNVDLTRQPAS